MAAATSSVKSWSRDSVSSGKGLGPFVVAIITPHGLPSTEIGTPMENRIPKSRTVAAMTPEACSYSFIRAGTPVRSTCADTLSPLSG